ncbi:hypothetical protein DFA_04653 [Cavenderia fasciculata]|uniref:Transmembrane protein n=1 Tax=Cavenderia fasciculata TaxID=261658 RepID=F4PQ62_CACFS|nr:uncharacterized protein DFA_04653 [Cavenderia fasciculata]EGG22525.1 hypothetical protein DFA_04653 [Cavenderia fasciculata]|eukprot:XP_004360376.1 hypothetical protein DFA_04653 [Cavenderia fasciculata]
MNRVNQYVWVAFAATTIGLAVGTPFCKDVVSSMVGSKQANDARLNELMRQVNSSVSDLDDEHHSTGHGHAKHH